MAINLTGQGGSIPSVSMAYSNATQKNRAWTDSGNKSIPAGAYYVKIYSQSTNNPITVNGETLFPDSSIEFGYKVNHVSKKQDLCPLITIEAANEDEIDYNVIYPSDSTVNLNNL